MPQNLNTSVASSPYWCVYLAAQIYLGDKGFLSKDIRVENMIDHRGDIHHIFPKDFLRKNGLTRGRYNQVANYTYMQSEINIKVGNKKPKEYFKAVLDQIQNGEKKYGGINTKEELLSNLKSNSIPELVIEAGIEDYDQFLQERRQLMTQKIKEYYKSL